MNHKKATLLVLCHLNGTEVPEIVLFSKESIKSYLKSYSYKFDTYHDLREILVEVEDEKEQN